MTQPAPKFEVGQRVMVVAPTNLKYRSSNAIITASDYITNESCTYYDGTSAEHTGWIYIVDNSSEFWTPECSLRPRPEPSAMSWNEMNKAISSMPAITEDLSVSNPYAEAGGLVTTESSWDAESARHIFEELTAKVLKTRDISGNG